MTEADRANGSGVARSAARAPAELPIGLLALDIDGTLVGHDFRISPRTEAAIRGAVARGVRVSLATGRMASSAAVYAHRLGLTEPLIGHQGAVVRRMPARASGTEPASQPGQPFRAPVGRLVHHTSLAAAVARDAITWCLAHDLDPHVNTLERIVVWRGDRRFEDYSGYLGPDAEIVADLRRAIRRPVSKVIAVGQAPRPMELVAEARLAFAGRAEVTVSHPRFLEFVALGVSKGRAVSWLARQGGIPMSRVMTIGDALNDLEMISMAGHGAAMSTAPDVVRAAARYIAPPVEDDGVATLIEALILAPPSVASRNARRLAGAAGPIAEAASTSGAGSPPVGAGT
jgi:hydroxymethylpyrimidine pyrophosphatase-like HAD family hydrolase